MTDQVKEVKQRAKRTPRSSEQVFKGALALDLADRVELRKQLDASIKEEVESLKTKAELAASLANGTGK